MDADDDPDGFDREPLTREIQRHGDPEQRVDEVLDVAGLCGREQRPVAVGRPLQHLVEREVRVVVSSSPSACAYWTVSLMRKTEMRNASTTNDSEEVERLRPKARLAGDDARDPRADGDAGVAERLVDADGEAALVGAARDRSWR